MKVFLRWQSWFVISICVVSVGVFFYTVVEQMPVIDAFYYSMMILATVGDASYTPSTNVAKVFTALYAVCGLLVLFSGINLVTDRIYEKNHEEI